MTEATGALVLNLECTLPAPPEEIFRMLTEPSELVTLVGPARLHHSRRRP